MSTDYVLSCALLEPSSCETEAVTSSSPLVAQPGAGSPLPLSPTRAWSLLTAFQKFMGWQDADLVDIEDLHATACTCTEHLLDSVPSVVSRTIASQRLPADSVALMFSALALGAVASSDFGHGRFYFDISTEVVKHSVGHATLELCLAFFLQHAFALRVGTLNYAQTIIRQAIQGAHDLELHHNKCGIQGLQLYLLIYMADQ